MVTTTILCILRDPAQLSALRENGYELVTATNGSDGLRLFASQSVDAIVLEYHLGLLDGACVAAEIKQVRPEVPIVMLADHLELPSDVLNSVDALVVKSDGAHFLSATIHFVLNVRPAQQQGRTRTQTPAHRRTGRSRGESHHSRAKATLLAPSVREKHAPFSPATWKSIRDGVLKF